MNPVDVRLYRLHGNRIAIMKGFFNYSICQQVLGFFTALYQIIFGG